MGIKILGHRVLVKPLKIESKTTGGIVLPDSVVEKNQFSVETGEVVEVGPYCREEPSLESSMFRPQVGDRVLFPSYVGNRYTDENKNLFFILRDEHIMAILDK